jgi:hypothetical protein
VATENAIEGCARETYGALVALWQESHAADPAISSVCAEIAPDEARHAALAWQVDDWARAHLSAAANTRVQAARQAAFEQLKCEACHPVPPELERRAGIPSHTQALSLLAGLIAADLGSARSPVA